MQLKCEVALMKLKSIFAYTKDYKMILESYKKGGLQKWLTDSSFVQFYTCHLHFIIFARNNNRFVNTLLVT
jgi:hypothetical protein